MKSNYLLSIFIILCGCSSDISQDNSSEFQNIERSIEANETNLDHFFNELDTNFTSNKLIYPENLHIQILFSETKDLVVRKDLQSSPAKGNHDMIAYLPIDGSSEHGWLYISHETTGSDKLLGDGGGGTMFEVELKKEKWEVVSEFHHVDFSSVGNTERNCGGVLAPNGMIYTCEEFEPKTNKDLWRLGTGHLDTADIGKLKYWQNIGYVVEVDPNLKKATKKMIQWGRYFHEDLEFMDDGKTVYLTDDFNPCVFFKFVAFEKGDYSDGQLFAFQQNTNSNVGSWITLPMDTSSLISIRDVAISMGASMFVRHEWLVRDKHLLYIAETGSDLMSWEEHVNKGGKPANHFIEDHEISKHTFNDYYGRILVFNTKTNELDIWLEGGVSKDGKTVLSNPDCIQMTSLGGKEYMVIHEDLIGLSHQRVPEKQEKKYQVYNEVYFIDMSIENPTVEDAVRFMVTPLGAEMTGGIFTPNGETFFVNLQHPHTTNLSPYNKSSTIAVTGWKK